MDPKDEGKRTIIADGTSFEGKLTSEGPVSISGKVDGELLAPTVEITETGSVKGKVVADELESKGELSGDIDAGKVNLAGTIKDDTHIRAQSLEVKLAASDPDKLQVTFGTTNLNVGDEGKPGGKKGGDKPDKDEGKPGGPPKPEGEGEGDFGGPGPDAGKK